MDYSQLIRDCIKNKRPAQQQLYELFAAQMLGVCVRYTKSIDDAEDVLQEGFVKVFNNLKTYQNSGELGAWIRRIMINTALSYLRRHSRYRKQMSFDEAPLYPVTAEQATVKLNTEALISTIQKLPAGYQTIFNLVAMEGFSHVEVSQMLSINENTSRSQYSRARALLIKWIKEEEELVKRKVAGRGK
jgi:RNA polymerase sigma factor (sigma-70 family)